MVHGLSVCLSSVTFIRSKFHWQTRTMRNIVVLRDQLYAIADGSDKDNGNLVSITFDKASSKMFTLAQDGTLLCFSDIDDDIEPVFRSHAYLGLSDVDADADHGWFDVTYIAGTGSIVMVSHSGVIASLEQEIESTDDNVRSNAQPTNYPLVAEQIGCIEGGIAFAAWSPDQSCLVIVTNNNTLLCMSSTWDVLLETPVPERLASGPTASISWRGDGEGFALTTVDKEDGVCRMRHYNKQLEVVATGRNVADGAASVMRGIGNVVAFASNGSYIAVCQQQRGAGNSATATATTASTSTTGSASTAVVGTKAQPKLQVALIERNGLRHGDFDLHLPPVPAGWHRWEECSLHWDLPTTLLAVGLRAVRDTNKDINKDASTDASTAPTGVPGLVQLYHRGNYHWYLKQQWAGQDLRFLGFDEELVNRFYLSQSLGAESGSTGTPVWRVVDFIWDIASTTTADSTVAVTDGQKLLLTPLGINNIPPPMCKHTISLTTGVAVTDISADSNLQGITYTNAGVNCARNVSFWQPCFTASCNDHALVQSSIAWGCASLGDNNTSLMIAVGDATGSVLSQHQVDVQALCSGDAALCDLFGTTAFRAVAASQQDGVVRITLLGSHVVPLTVPASSGPCDSAAPRGELSTECLLVLELAYDLQLHTFAALPTRCEVVPLPGGCATRVVPVPHQPSVFAVGVIRSSVEHNGSEFEIYKVHLGDGPGQAEEELVASLPEQCTHIAFIAAHCDGKSSAVDGESVGASVADAERASTVIALSLRNRLYCGASLLASGASSFVYNESFEILMYGTLGTRPHLHFCALSRLLALDPMQHSEDQESAECAEPRPVERGAKLVISAQGSSRVVLQLPRGNLETIEPRPLILLRAQQLLHDNQLLDCLVLLRKQRVDLNYVVDYSPRIFFDNVTHFVSTMLRTNHDLISLLVTALEPVDVTVHKYPLFATAPGFMQAREVADFTGDNKVNRVCTAVRNVLLPILYAARSATKVDDVHSSKVLQPILCTFARQRPPQLVEALDLIRFCCTTGGIITAVSEDTVAGTPPSASISGGTANLSSPMAQVSIKYLAFLAEGTQLFDAALGICDFEMTRAVARQCQMDPKVYLPLVESFEALGRGFESSSPQVAIMHFKVNQHLKRFPKAVEWAVTMLESAHTAHSVNRGSDDVSLMASITAVIQELKVIIKAEDLHKFTLPKLAALELKLRLDAVTVLSATSAQAQGSNPYDVVICKLVSDLRLQWGQICASKMEYAEALASIMATQPVHALEAVEVAKQWGNWQLALSIAGRYQHEERYSGVAEIKPVYIAQQIVSEFRENLEQGGTCENLTSTVEGGADGSTTAEGDKVLEAARLCVDYCSDHEGAISLLTTAQRWLPALQLALRYARKDLLFEIAGAARMAAEELIAELPRRVIKMRALVQELAELWVNSAERLKNVASTDITLMDELNGVDAANQRQNDDTMSEYSAVTQQSTFSRTSTRSGSSQYSTKSGSSVVSVLSNLSAASHQSALDRDSKSVSAFSIAGLDHSLLSRGTVTAKSEQAEGGGAGKDGKRSKKQYRRDQTERRQKRIERSKAKGASKDVWGLRREGTACEELLVYARQLPQLGQSIRELCEALQLISEPGDLALCMALQSACDTYMRFVQQNPPSVAPNYPREWLTKRLLTSVQHYQDPVAYATAAAALPHNQVQEVPGGSVAGAGVFTASGVGNMLAQGASVTTWWDIAAAGLRGWYATTRLTFSTGATGNKSC